MLKKIVEEHNHLINPAFDVQLTEFTKEKSRKNSESDQKSSAMHIKEAALENKTFIKGADMIDLYGLTFCGSKNKALTTQAYEKMIDTYAAEFRNVEADLHVRIDEVMGSMQLS